MTNLSAVDEDELSSNDISIVNIVAKLDLDTELDLPYLFSQLPHSSYEPERYPSIIFRPDSCPTVLITSSGVILFTGGDSKDSLIEAFRRVRQEFEHLGLKHEKSINDIEIVNIVSTLEFDFQLDLNMLLVSFGMDNVEYEPEQFPGLVYRLENGPVVNIFSSGKVVITGADSTKDILVASETIRRSISKEAASS